MRLMFAMLLLTFVTFSGCIKDKIEKQTPTTESLIADTDPKKFAENNLAKEVFNQFDWNSCKPTIVNGKLLGWKVSSLNNFKDKSIYIIIGAKDNLAISIQLNEVIVQSDNKGRLKPTKIVTTNLLSQKIETINLPNTVEEKSTLRVVKKQSLVSTPFSTLPIVTVTAKYNPNGSTTQHPNGGTSYLMAGLLGYSTGSGGGGGEGGSFYNPYIYLDALEPDFGGTGGESQDWPEVIDFNYTRVVKGIRYSVNSYPGMNRGMQFAWWENYKMPGTYEEHQDFQHTQIFFYDAYYNHVEDYPAEFEHLNFNQLRDRLVSGNYYAFPLIPLIAKALASGLEEALSDLVIQLFFEYLISADTDDVMDIISRIDIGDLGVSLFNGIFDWGGKKGELIRVAVGVLKNMLTSDKDYSVEEFFTDFGTNLAQGLAAGMLSEKIGKYDLDKVAAGLLRKFDFPYSKVCKWLGYGLKEVIETVNGNITSARRMIGWDPNKVAIIGRQMDTRVKVFAASKPGSVIFDEANPVAAKYFTASVKAEWKELNRIHNNNIPYDIAKNSKMFAANQQFIIDLKNEGYTFIDCGSGTSTIPSAFYDMELGQIFN